MPPKVHDGANDGALVLVARGSNSGSSPLAGRSFIAAGLVDLSEGSGHAEKAGVVAGGHDLSSGDAEHEDGGQAKGPQVPGRFPGTRTRRR
jgi:hypothetical protein